MSPRTRLLPMTRVCTLATRSSSHDAPSPRSRSHGMASESAVGDVIAGAAVEPVAPSTGEGDAAGARSSDTMASLTPRIRRRIADGELMKYCTKERRNVASVLDNSTRDTRFCAAVGDSPQFCTHARSMCNWATGEPKNRSMPSDTDATASWRRTRSAPSMDTAAGAELSLRRAVRCSAEMDTSSALSAAGSCSMPLAATCTSAGRYGRTTGNAGTAAACTSARSCRRDVDAEPAPAGMHRVRMAMASTWSRPQMCNAHVCAALASMLPVTSSRNRSSATLRVADSSHSRQYSIVMVSALRSSDRPPTSGRLASSADAADEDAPRTRRTDWTSTVAAAPVGSITTPMARSATCTIAAHPSDRAHNGVSAAFNRSSAATTAGVYEDRRGGKVRGGDVEGTGRGGAWHAPKRQ
jgi:hypothetical protein